MNTITIKGMHCDACKKLIMMELDDAGLTEGIASIEVVGENKGILTFTDTASEDVVHAVRECINAMDGYSLE